MLRPNFADLDDAATFCGTAFPESSKPLVLLLMASNMSDLCYRGTPGAFSGGVSDVMLAAEKWFNHWGTEAPVSLSEFDDGNAMCEWFLDRENGAIIELAEAVNPELLGAGPRLSARDQCKTLPLDDQGGIKGGLDRVWRVGNRESLLRCASRASLAAHKREVLEVLQWSLVPWGHPLRARFAGRV